MGRSDMSSRGANLAFPALHAGGHSSPNDYGKLSSASSSNDIDELTSRLNDLLGEGSDQNDVTSETRMPFNKELDKFIGELPSINKYLNMFNRKGDRKKKRKKGKGKRNQKKKKKKKKGKTKKKKKKKKKKS